MVVAFSAGREAGLGALAGFEADDELGAVVLVRGVLFETVLRKSSSAFRFGAAAMAGRVGAGEVLCDLSPLIWARRSPICEPPDVSPAPEVAKTCRRISRALTGMVTDC